MKSRYLILWTLGACASWTLAGVRPVVSQGAGTIGLFEQQCAMCHVSKLDDRAPTRELLRQRSPESILESITTGSMANNAAGLSEQQKRDLAEYLSGRSIGSIQSGEASAMPNRCARTPLGNPMHGSKWNGWGLDLGNSRFQPNPGMSPEQARQLKLKWAFGFSGGSSAYGQPTIVGGRVYVGADTGFVYSLDARSGCVHWSFRAQAGVRTAITLAKLGTQRRTRYAVYFGDIKANVYAVDAENGDPIWTRLADAHPLARITGAPTLSNNRLYVPVASLEELAGGNPKYECCTFRGAVVAYDVNNGDVIWKTYTIPIAPKPREKTSRGTQLWAPAGAAVWSAPTIDTKRGLLYVATGDAYTAPAADTSDAVLALEVETGRLIWSKQFTAGDVFVWPCEVGNFSETCPPLPGPDFDFGNSRLPRWVRLGREIMGIGEKAGGAWALDPQNKGTLVWEHRVGKGSWDGSLVWGSAADNERGYFPNGDAYFGPAEAGGLTALKLKTGKREWITRPPSMTCEGAPGRTCVQAQTSAVTVIPGVVFSGTISGVMRAYRTTDGQIIWEYNTARSFVTVNGVEAKGGSLNGPGPTVAGGMLFMNSGYATIGGGMPGNVLLAFGIN